MNSKNWYLMSIRAIKGKAQKQFHLWGKGLILFYFIIAEDKCWQIERSNLPLNTTIQCNALVPPKILSIDNNNKKELFLRKI